MRVVMESAKADRNRRGGQEEAEGREEIHSESRDGGRGIYPYCGSTCFPERGAWPNQTRNTSGECATIK